MFPNLARDLGMLKRKETPSEYIIIACINALIYGLILYALLFTLLYLAKGTPPLYDEPLAPALATFVLFTFFFWVYPKILVSKMMEGVDRDLVFALKDLSAQLESGMTLFDALRSVSKSGYGIISKELEYVVKDISAGRPEQSAFSKMMQRTESEYVKKTTWQLVSILKSGASMRSALQSIISSLNQHQNEKISSYIQEMNLWVLLFLVISVAVPSLGATLIIILSSIGGIGLSREAFFFLLFLCFASEILMIKYLKLRRPIVYM